MRGVTPPAKDGSANASAVASPTANSALPMPSRAASSPAFSTIAGVRSMPVTRPTLPASAREMAAGPQATSSQLASGSAGTRSRTTPSVSAAVAIRLRAKLSVWWVNSLRIESSYMRWDVMGERESQLASHQPHQLQGAGLMERFVEVAALGTLDAGGAAGLAGALGAQPLGNAEQALELLVAAPGDPDPAGVAVVDEDRRAAGLEVDVGREAADVPAVAHRDQRQDGELAVLGGVQGAEQRLGRQLPAQRVRQHVPERLGDEVLLGQFQGDDVDRLLVGDGDALEGDHLLGHRDLAEVELHTGHLALLVDALDEDLGLLFRPR